MPILGTGQVFASYEPNMPRVATASEGGQDTQQKSIVRSSSAISLTGGKGKVSEKQNKNS